ncbi:MAG: DUF2523 domain-containing protein [Candidatus Saccharibacteria bacterium]|nr:DUF2523 domain-containing protein [Candidatus Saccharibacteria bacterium]
MIKILLPLAKFFESNIGALVHKGLAAAGIGIISYAAVSTAFNAVLSMAQTHYNNIGVDMLALMGLGGIGEAIGIMVGAMTFKVAMNSMKRLGLKQ